MAGLSLLSASCGGSGDTTAPPPQIGSLSISPASPAPIPAGGTLQLSATVRDTQGQLMSGQAVTYTTNAPLVATVSGQGVVSAIGPVGTATITASAGSATTNVLISVAAGAASSLTRTSADPASISAGASAGDSVRYRVTDAFGNPRVNETLTFTVAAGNGQTSPASAQTDAQGRAATRFRTGTTAGQNTLTATVGGVAPNSFSLTTVASSVSISSVSPSPMTRGAIVTINGSGFSAATADDAVTIDGVAASVTTASSTQLTFVVPPALPCTPTHSANLELNVNGNSAFAQQTLQTGTLRSLAVGSTVVLGAADLACTELSPASAWYTVSVVNTSQAVSATTPFRLGGAIAASAGASPVVKPFVLHQTMIVPVPRRAATAEETEQRVRAVNHRRILEANRAIYRRERSHLRALRQARVAASPSVLATPRVPNSVRASVNVGDTRAFRVIQFTGGSGTYSCSNFIEITARAVYVGAKSIVYEDAAAPLAGQMDSYYVRLGQEFDATMYPSVSSYFGDPLINDANTDNDQHLNMVFSQSVPSGVLGFVTGCDFSPRNTTTNQGSNFGENFYGAVATVAGTGSGNTADNWLRGVRSTVVHEVKHVASFTAHIVNDAVDFEEIWLEEGMAMTAMEVWVRDAFYRTAWKGNADYRSTLYCDVRPTTCPNAPFVMYDHFQLLYDFLEDPGSFSVFGPISGSDPTYYGSAWSFIRWNADRYASSEVGFLRGITQAVDVLGLANIARQAGANGEQMQAMWSLALYLDENNAVAANPDLKFSGWNMRDIFRGMSADYPQFFPKTFPLAAQSIPSASFSIDNSGIRGGSFALYDLPAVSGSTRAISLVPNPATGSPLRLVIARIE